MDDTFGIFVSIGVAIVIEAAPFLALGSLLSALVEVFVSPARLARVVPTSLGGRVALGVSAGLVVPTCECGVVPVARRLLTKGTPLTTVVAYLLTAPIVNPVVLISTFVAFRGSWTMVGARAGVAMIVAAIVAFVIRNLPVDEALRADPESASGEHVHAAGPVNVLRHAAIDFLDMGKYLVFGAFAAAAVKTFAPAELIQGFGGSLVLSIGGMMLLAIVLSVCSEADAFVAASFLTLPAAAHLAFMTIGPMVDLKLIALYAATFRKRLFLALLIIPIVLVFVLSLFFGVLT